MHKFSTGFRSLPLLEGLKQIESCLSQLGITRLSDITGLDRVGIPVWQAFRPASKYPVTVFSGKGSTLEEAKMSALMEAMESYVTENYQPAFFTGTFFEAKAQGLNPCPVKDLCLPSSISENTVLDWMSLSMLSNSKTVSVPKELVKMPCPDRLWPATTNGIASGFTLEEALLHGIFEVVERDALSFALATRNSRATPAEYLNLPLVSALLSKIEASGLRCLLHDITLNGVDIPSYYVLLWDPGDTSPWFVSSGSGSHLDPEIALVRAISEAVQSRTCMIAGAREDLRDDLLRLKNDPDKVFETLISPWQKVSPTPAKLYPKVAAKSIEENLSEVVETLSKRGFEILFADLTLPSLPFRVVRIVVPLMESFVIDKQRVGTRLAACQPLLKKAAIAEQK